MAFDVLEKGVTLVYLSDQNLGRPSHSMPQKLCALNSKSDDHSTDHDYVVSRVVTRLNSEFCIPLFLGFDSGLNYKSI